MKTPEEIIKKHTLTPEADYSDSWVKSAMEEYASQLKASPPLSEKPDFEALAEKSNPNVITEKYLYDDGGHQRLNPRWQQAQEFAETYRRCEIVGMERIWNDYVLPLQSQLSEKDKQIEELTTEKQVAITSYQFIESEKQELIEALRETNDCIRKHGDPSLYRKTSSLLQKNSLTH
jgi:hypothetical protein